ncbi:MAG: glycosyltransferase [Anaerolineae bacterium]
MSETSPFVSAIIPVYNDAARLALCLEALAAQTYPADRFEVIVVDNGSAEAPEAVVSRFPNARLLMEPQPGSYAARNLGLAHARGECLAFTDSDCIPAANWLERGIAALHRQPNTGLVGGCIELFPADPAHPTPAELYEILTAFRVETMVERFYFSPTANLFTFRHVFERVGPFNAALPSAGDSDWGQRVHAAGYRLVYDEDVVVRHPARHSVKELRLKAARVAVGLDLKRRLRGETTPRHHLAFYLEDFVPPLRTLKRIATAKGLSIRQKLQVVFVLVQVRAARLSAKLRHLIGRPMEVR